jgi:hypothetical protein
MKNHFSHFAICGLALAIGIVLAATGTSVLAILPGLGCLLMMVLMMWGMGSLHGKNQ